MRRSFLFFVALVVLAPGVPVLAADISASVAKITGKCQLQAGNDWTPLTVGQVLPVGATVSTGFRSELQLKIGPSTITVKALSRLTVKDLVQSGSDVKTDLYLKVGKISAEVNKDDSVATNQFKVGSPVSTASVRGTSFTFDGVSLQVARGMVDFADLRGNVVSVPVGEAARALGSGQGLVPNQTLVAQDSTTQANAGSDFGSTTESDSWQVSSFDGFSYSDLVDGLYGYDWYNELPGVHITVGGITPLPVPTTTHITIGGVTPVPVPIRTHVTIGGIQ
ncbi:MAG TPA: FecR domain-containing protein [Spirochaetia bacterium]|nr:FecR domain-containing protein [Spirochaetia bacterium]